MKEKEQLTRRRLIARIATVAGLTLTGSVIRHLFNTSNSRADSSTTDLPFKNYLQITTNNFAEATPTPVPENPALKDTVLVEKLETQLNGKSYTVESRISADAPYQANIQPDLRQPLIDLVAKDGQRLGFNRAVILIVKTADQLPAGNQVTWSAVLPNDGQKKYITIGKTGSQWLSPDKILVYEYLPNGNLPYSYQPFKDSLDGAMANGFLRTTYFGDRFGEGNLDSEHVILMNKNPILIFQR